MASTPLVFKRTKGKPTQRARQTSPENDTNESAQTVGGESLSTLASKLKNKVKRTKPKSRLSFGGDDEESGGDVFQVKKSNLSRKLALGKHPNIPPNLDQATISPNRGPTYDQAYLNELKANTPTSRPGAIADPYDADTSMDIEEVSMMSIDVVPGSEAIIPSDSSIKMAKDRRERLRKTGVSGEEEFISLSVVHSSGQYQGPHPESRLMREEDDLGEGDDEFADYTSAQERIALGKKARKAEASQRRDAMKEMIADVEEDEESTEWEQEQLRRGGHMAPDSRPSTPSKIKEIYKPAPIPPEVPIPTLSSAMARLTEQLTQLTTSHAKNTATLNALAQERAEVDNKETEMREMVATAEDKRAWFNSFKDWLEGVAGFLDEKYPLLEKLEEEHISLFRERFDMVMKRRHAEDEDELSIILGPLPVPPPVNGEVEEIDELGRVISKPSPAALRRERREARIMRRQFCQRQYAKTGAEEGYSTDSSLPTQDASAYSSALKDLALRKKEVLADVRAEEFHDPGKGQWKVWRDKYTDSYVGAWGGLGVVSVWEFWVRLEMVGWDCIENPRSLDSFKWYKGLYAYSRPGDQSDGEHEIGPDGDLVASMISTAVIPRLSAIITGGALDPYSETHVRRVIHLTEEIEASIEHGSTKFQTLLKSITAMFQSTVSETYSLLAKFKAMHHKASNFDPEAIPARRRFLTRRLKLLQNILRWRKYTGERFGLDLLVKQLVENCFLDIAVAGWEVGGEELTRKVVEMLPNDLIPHELKIRLGI